MTLEKNLSIQELLSDGRLIHSAFPSVKTILEMLLRSDSVKLVYGETYDHYGPTLDSLKYYFFIALLRAAVVKKGGSAQSSVIVGDLHSVKNKIVTDKSNLLASADTRLDFVKKINNTYNLKIEPVLMSDLFAYADFKQRLSKMKHIFQKSEDLKDIARKTVLKNRLTQEEKVGFQYTLEEVALITGFDIKIGPPRELYYDQIARKLGIYAGNQDFCGLYLTPTYPLGMGFDFFVTHPEIEEYGVTPYKAGSNKLQDHRIILGTTSLEECRRLINNSFISNNPSLPSPVSDLYGIAKMAGFLLTGELFTSSEDVMEDQEAIKSMAYEALAENVYKPLGYK